MRLTFLGSASGEGYPVMWCRCPNCITARSRGGRDLRYRSALLINDDLLIDAGPDVPAAAARFGIDLAPVQALLITHAHDDHLDPRTLTLRHLWATATPLPMLHVYGSPRAVKIVRKVADAGPISNWLHLSLHEVYPFRQFCINTGGRLAADPRGPAIPGDTPTSAPRRYEVWSLAARHMEPGDEALLFAVRQIAAPEVASRRSLPMILYAIDTGPFPNNTWQTLDRMASEGVRFDAVIVDGTLGLGKPGELHMNFEQTAAQCEELEGRGCSRRTRTALPVISATTLRRRATSCDRCSLRTAYSLRMTASGSKCSPGPRS